MADVNGGCELGDLLSGYLDGELLPGELDILVDHLATCLDCIDEFHQMQEVRALLRTLPLLEIPERLLPATHLGAGLSAYLDGALDTVEFMDVSSHLESCARCRGELFELDAARTAVRALPVLEPPEFLGLRRQPHRQPVRPSRRLVTWAAGMAAAAVAAVALSTTAPAPPQVDLDSFAERHVARASLDPGYSVIPAVSPLSGETP